jgi:hypothetical protein
MRKLIALAIIGSSLLIGAGQAQASAAQPSGTIRTLMIDLDGRGYDWAQVAPTYKAIALNDWDTSWAAQIKAASPVTRPFVYKDLSSTRSDDCGSDPAGGSPCIVNGVFCPRGVNDAPFYAGGIGFCWAWRNHPDWFLRNSAGTLIQYAGYPGTYMMDFGNHAYQEAWLAAVTKDVSANGWAGVLMDNAIDNTNYGTPARYPTAAAVQAGMLSMLKVVGPGLASAHIHSIANLGYNNVFPGIWSQWLPYVTGLMNEFTYYWPGNTAEGSGAWSTYEEPEVKACAASNKLCLFHVGDRNQPTTQAQNTFATASFLLYSNGRSFVSYGADGTADPQTRLGAADGPAFRTADGIWHRDFADGSVSVNVTAGTGTVSIGPPVGPGSLINQDRAR